MLIVYFVDFGVTQIVVPKFLRSYFGELLDLSMQFPSAPINVLCTDNADSRLALLRLYGLH